MQRQGPVLRGCRPRPPLHAGSRLALQQSERKNLPTDDTQHTENMDLNRGVTLPTNKQLLSVATVSYCLFICLTAECVH